jgi:non-specific serine/threonine protein kinase
MHPGHFFSQLGAVMQAALAGDRKAMEQAATAELSQVVECDPHYSWNFAQCYAAIGDTANAVVWLEKAMAKGFINYPMISRWDPLLAGVRHTAHFDELVDRVRDHWENFEV